MRLRFDNPSPNVKPLLTLILGILSYKEVINTNEAERIIKALEENACGMPLDDMDVYDIVEILELNLKETL